MNKNKIGYIRPYDGELFTENIDGTYSIDRLRQELPNSLLNSYSAETLADSGFEKIDMSSVGVPEKPNLKIVAFRDDTNNNLYTLNRDGVTFGYQWLKSRGVPSLEWDENEMFARHFIPIYQNPYYIDSNGKILWDNVEVKKAEVNLHSTMDAKVWTDEFCKTYEKLYNQKIDEEWIYGWMCDAIMCGYDHQSWQRDNEYIYILKTAGGDILKVFHYEPSEKNIKDEYVKHYPEDLVGNDYKIFDYVRLYRWSRSYGLMEMSGPKSDTQYEWKNNQ